MDIDDGQSPGGVAIDAGAGDIAGLIGGIVEHLNVEEFARIIELRNGIDQALNHVALIEDGKLYSNLWPARDGWRRGWNIFAIGVVIVEELVTMHAIGGQHEKNKEIGNHHGHVESIGMIDAAESAVGELVPVIAKRALLDEQ